MKFQHVADVLRMEIADGTYAVGQHIPTQAELVRRFKVSRATVQRALEDLQAEGWIEARQGSGTTVLPRPRPGREQPARITGEHSPLVTLGPYMQAAFEAEHVTLDLFTLTAESMDAHLRTQTVRIQNGEIRPRSITVRLLVPSLDIRLALPRAKDDPEDQRPAERLRGKTRLHVGSLRDALLDLRYLGLVPEVSVRVRSVPVTPLSKLYLLNRREALHGFYRVVERPVAIGGEEEVILDALGTGATLFREIRDESDPTSRQSIFVETAQRWFDSLWEYLSEGTALDD